MEEARTRRPGRAALRRPADRPARPSVVGFLPSFRPDGTWQTARLRDAMGRDPDGPPLDFGLLRRLLDWMSSPPVSGFRASSRLRQTNVAPRPGPQLLFRGPKVLSATGGARPQGGHDLIVGRDAAGRPPARSCTQARKRRPPTPLVEGWPWGRTGMDGRTFGSTRPSPNSATGDHGSANAPIPHRCPRLSIGPGPRRSLPITVPSGGDPGVGH